VPPYFESLVPPPPPLTALRPHPGVQHLQDVPRVLPHAGEPPQQQGPVLEAVRLPPPLQVCHRGLHQRPRVVPQLPARPHHVGYALHSYLHVRLIFPKCVLARRRGGGQLASLEIFAHKASDSYAITICACKLSMSYTCRGCAQLPRGFAWPSIKYVLVQE